MKRSILVAAVLAALLSPAFAQSAPTGDRYAGAPLRERIFFGGGIGLAFGDVDYVSISPVVGFRASERLSTGIGLLYQHREDGRFVPKLKTDDYGASLFARYTVTGPLFLSAELEYLDYERLRFDLSTERSRLTSALAGAGIYQPLGRHAAGYFAVLYNFTYDDNDLGDPYDSPWVYRAGVEIGF